MYKDFYHMQTEAFGSLPVLNLFFNSRVHQDGWRYLVSGIMSQEPFLLVTGDYGMGKTLLCLMLVRLLQKKKNIPFVYITTPSDSYTKMLGSIAECLNIDIHLDDDSHVLAVLHRHFKTLAEKKTAFYIIIDDAQELDASILAKLRALANFNHEGFFPFRIVFFAHTSFVDLLKNPLLIPLGQRIKRRHRLVPFDLQDAREYIYFRLYKSGAPGTLSFTDDALNEIYASSRGVPRIINNICDASLLRGALKMERVIDRATVREALADYGEVFSEERTPSCQIFSSTAFMRGTAPPAIESNNPLHDASAVPMSASVYSTMQGAPDASQSTIPAASAAIEIEKKASRPRISMVAVLLVILGVVLLALIRQYGVFTSPRQELIPRTASKPAEARNSSDNADTVDNGSIAAASSVASTVPGSDNLSAPELQTPQAALSDVSVDPPVVVNRDDNETAAGEQDSSCVYTLRLACFRTSEDVRNASAYYKRRGLSPYIVKVKLEQRGIWWLFYLGKYKTRDEAVQSRMAHNLPDAFIKNMPYANLIGIFSSEGETAEMVLRLEHLGYYPYILKKDDSAVRMYVGAFMYREGAEAQRRSLESAGIKNKVVCIAGTGKDIWSY